MHLRGKGCRLAAICCPSCLLPKLRCQAAQAAAKLSAAENFLVVFLKVGGKHYDGMIAHVNVVLKSAVR